MFCNVPLCNPCRITASQYRRNGGKKHMTDWVKEQKDSASDPAIFHESNDPDWPNICPRCKGPAFESFTSIECKDKNCSQD